MQHYLQTSVVFHNSEIRTPTLFFCSEDDPVALYYIVERIADRWEQNGCPVSPSYSLSIKKMDAYFSIV